MHHSFYMFSLSDGRGTETSRSQLEQSFGAALQTLPFRTSASNLCLTKPSYRILAVSSEIASRKKTMESLPVQIATRSTGIVSASRQAISKSWQIRCCPEIWTCHGDSCWLMVSGPKCKLDKLAVGQNFNWHLIFKNFTTKGWFYAAPYVITLYILVLYIWYTHTYMPSYLRTCLPAYLPTSIHTWPELTWPHPTFPYCTMGTSYTCLLVLYLASYPDTPSYLATLLPHTHTHMHAYTNTLAMFVWRICKLTFLWARSEIRACRVHSHSRALVLRFRRYYSDNGGLKARRLACELCCFLRPPVVGTAGMERHKSWSFGCCLRRYQQYVKVNHFS